MDLTTQGLDSPQSLVLATLDTIALVVTSTGGTSGNIFLVGTYCPNGTAHPIECTAFVGAASPYSPDAVGSACPAAGVPAAALFLPSPFAPVPAVSDALWTLMGRRAVAALIMMLLLPTVP